ncbi:MAG: hypothetical protein ACRDD2_14235, partial [Sarcina sp.]
MIKGKVLGMAAAAVVGVGGVTAAFMAHHSFEYSKALASTQSKVSSYVQSSDQSMTKAEGIIKKANANIMTDTATIKSLTGQVANLKSQITTKNNEISALNNNISNLNGKIKELNGEIASNKAKIASLTTALGEANKSNQN